MSMTMTIMLTMTMTMMIMWMLWMEMMMTMMRMLMSEVFVLVLPDIRRCPRLKFRHWRHHTEEEWGGGWQWWSCWRWWRWLWWWCWSSALSRCEDDKSKSLKHLIGMLEKNDSYVKFDVKFCLGHGFIIPRRILAEICHRDSLTMLIWKDLEGLMFVQY